LDLPTTTVSEITARIAECLDLPDDRLTPDTVLTDLVADSFRLVEMAIELQEHYGVLFGQQDMKGICTVADLATLVQSRL
jgi:acyl carrier protein